ncbi:hypothetical protein AK812_SmicGene15882 [Symbiodinium microadriaticum]|uniref:Uncharacterized protein n=1 Tax=Symbiodinium microadriaticum TaxID=2951 RepID=A0A1Q9E1T5_SYMMI|nr:hypothetical protein AK812_SmicGene15882 [Symbiodinium microadriaticum]
MGSPIKALRNYFSGHGKFLQALPIVSIVDYGLEAVPTIGKFVEGVLAWLCSVKTGTGELPYLCEVFHQRLAEIFSNVQLPQLSRCPSERKAQNTPQLRNATLLARISQMRLGEVTSTVESIVQANESEAVWLVVWFKNLRDRQVMEDLCGVASLKSQKKALDHLLRIVDSAPLVDLQQRADDLCNIEADKGSFQIRKEKLERAIEDALLTRLRRVTFRGCGLEMTSIYGGKSMMRASRKWIKSSRYGPTSVTSDVMKLAESSGSRSPMLETILNVFPSSAAGTLLAGADIETLEEQASGIAASRHSPVPDGPMRHEAPEETLNEEDEASAGLLVSKDAVKTHGWGSESLSVSWKAATAICPFRLQPDFVKRVQGECAGNFADFRALAKEKSMCEEVPGLVKDGAPNNTNNEAWPLDRLQQEFENEASDGAFLV